MKELVITIARALVDEPDAIEVREIEDGAHSLVELRVAKSDIGKVIGKDGKTAQSIRMLLAAASQKAGRRVHLDIIDGNQPLDFIEVARIVKPHGLGGELGVLMHWEDSDALEMVERVRLLLPDGSSREATLGRIKPLGKGYLVKLVGVDDRNAAEALRDAKILVDRAVIPPPDEGEIFLSDLVGRIVVGPNQERIGRVTEVISYPSVDSLVIEREDGSHVEQPLVEDWVLPFEPGSDQILLTSLEGLVG